MRKIILFSCCLFLFILDLFAQSTLPHSFNYQGAVRKPDGTPLGNAKISIRLSIITDEVNGSVVYYEVRKLQTNALGLYAFAVNGEGYLYNSDREGKLFTAIDWALGQKFLRIEIDPNGAEDFNLVANTQILSAPYAIYAEQGGTSGYNIWSKKTENLDKSVDDYLNFLKATSNSQNLNVDNGGLDGFLSINNGDGAVLKAAEIKLDKQIFNQQSVQSVIDAINTENENLLLKNGIVHLVKKEAKNIISNDLSVIGAPSVFSEVALNIKDNVITANKIAPGAVGYSHLSTDAVSTSKILDGTIQNSDVNTTAGIEVSKLASGTDGQILTTVLGIPTWTNQIETASSKISNTITGHQIANFTNEKGISNAINESITSLNHENQQLQFTNETGNTTMVDLSSYLDNTDAQTLRIDGQALSISGGNSIQLPSANSQFIKVSGGNSIEVSGTGNEKDAYVISIPSNAISSNQLASGSVTGPKIGGNAVTTSKILDGTIQNNDININAGIEVSKLASGIDGQILTTISGKPRWSNTIITKDLDFPAENTAFIVALIDPASGKFLKTSTSEPSLISNGIWDYQLGFNRTLNIASGSSNAINLSMKNFPTGAKGTLVVFHIDDGTKNLILPVNSKIQSRQGKAMYPVLSERLGAVDVLEVYFDGKTYYWSIGKFYD